MPPTLRSKSAQNSPITNSSPSSTPSSTPGKVPHCQSCGRPRAGHPKSGCPFTEAQTPTKSKSTKETNLSDALGGLNLTQEQEDKAFIRQRRRSSQASPLKRRDTLLSLSASSKEIAEELQKPGVMGKQTKVVHWSESVLSPSPSAARRRSATPSRTVMPCSLFTPTPESSIESIGSDVFYKQEPHTQTALDLSPLPSDEGSVSSIDSSFPKSRPLQRTMSEMERDVFVARLAQEVPASVYFVPKADVEELEARARDLKFCVYVSAKEGGDDAHALLIVGRSENAVQDVLRDISIKDQEVSARKAEPDNSKSPPSMLRAVAGGALAGVVGTWAGLAFA